MDTAKIGRDYEDIVEALLRTVVRTRSAAPRRGRRGARDDEVVVQRGPRLLGRSGQEHRIDISFSLSVAGVEILVLVECKCYGHEVGVDDLLEFSARLDDLGANKGIFVTNQGFASGARKVARAKRIALVIARRGRWEVVHRLQGEPPRWDPTWCTAGSALLSAGRSGVELGLCPVDTLDLLAIQGGSVARGAAVDPEALAEGRVRERMVFSIVEEGSRRFRVRASVDAQGGVRLPTPDEVAQIIRQAMERSRRVEALEARLAAAGADDPSAGCARVLIQAGELDAAEFFTRGAERKRPDDPVEVVGPTLTLSRLLGRAGRQDLAEVGYRQALAVIEALPPGRAPVTPVEVLTELAELASSGGRLDEAERCLREALDRLRTPAAARAEEDRRGAVAAGGDGDRSGLVATLARLAALERGRGRLREAEAWYREALGACGGRAPQDGAGSLAEEGELLVGLASLVRAQERREEAAELLRRAVAAFRALRRAVRSDPPAAYGEGARLLGEMCLSDGRVEEAREALLEALDVARQRAFGAPSPEAEAAVERALAALAVAWAPGPAREGAPA